MLTTYVGYALKLPNYQNTNCFDQFKGFPVYRFFLMKNGENPLYGAGSYFYFVFFIFWKTQNGKSEGICHRRGRGQETFDYIYRAKSNPIIEHRRV